MSIIVLGTTYQIKKNKKTYFYHRNFQNIQQNSHLSNVHQHGGTGFYLYNDHIFVCIHVHSIHLNILEKLE